MTLRENTMAILNYEKYDCMPIVHFGYWGETIDKWRNEGYIGNESYEEISRKLGFDFEWQPQVGAGAGLNPCFEYKELEITPEGFKKIVNGDGVIQLIKDGIVSIPMEIDHLLKDRESYEKYYKPKLQFFDERIPSDYLKSLLDKEFEIPLGINCGSMIGEFRNWIGVEGLSYLTVDDEELFEEILEDIGNLSYECTKRVLESGVKFDFAHFWEDICYKNGPLVNPSVFYEKVGPLYKRITDLLKAYGVKIVSLDCDGCIDALIPTWIENGVNTMFPIEVGTWNANIEPWRVKYGKEIRGVGGMNKNVFALDYSAVDNEIERLRHLVELGGYIPCPDHRIAPDAKFENVQYYCDKMRKTFNK